ncbi:MAG: preprotein translocase subunit SecE [Anaerolineae bacterium]|nr:preprotein translocase subunit SecE [Anaerolineae bacterium]
MSAGESLNDKRKRRRELRRQAEETAAVETVEVDDEFEGEDDDEEDDGRGLTERKGRATPGRRTQEMEEAKEDGNFVTRRVRGLREYIEGVRSEVQKIVWPTREETRRLTIIVLTTTIIASLVLGIISLLFNEYIIIGIQQPALVFGISIVAVIVVFAYYLRRSNRRTSSF